MSNDKRHTTIGDEIADLFDHSLEDLVSFLEEKDPRRILKFATADTLHCEFRSQFEQFHAEALKGWMKERQDHYLDSHKLASIAILATLKVSPLHEWRNNCLREDHLLNEMLAVLLGQRIMMNVRMWKFCVHNDSCDSVCCENIQKITWLYLFPEPIFDNNPPIRRLLWALAFLADINNSLLSYARPLAYLCYLLDVHHVRILEYYRSLHGGKGLSIPIDIQFPNNSESYVV